VVYVDPVRRRHEDVQLLHRFGDFVRGGSRHCAIVELQREQQWLGEQQRRELRQ
jgi:hypothetical protein